MIKVCSKCKQGKFFICFSADKGKKANKDGLRSQCKECRSKKNREWHEKNKAKSLENSRNWKLSNFDKVVIQAKKWRENNKERHAQNNSRWKANNKAANRKISSKYRSSKIMASPSWLNFIHKAQIQEFYDIAEARSFQTGVMYHVDHIHPLQGRGFNGLHVPWNLQIISGKENIIKKNNIPKNEYNLFWGV